MGPPRCLAWWRNRRGAQPVVYLVMSDHDDPETFLRKRNRNRLLWMVGLLVLLGAAVGGWWMMQPSGCAELAARLCDGTVPCPENFGASLEQDLPSQACTEALDTLRAAEVAVPPEMVPRVRAEVFNQLVLEHMGVDLLEQAGMPRMVDPPGAP